MEEGEEDPKYGFVKIVDSWVILDNLSLILKDGDEMILLKYTEISVLVAVSDFQVPWHVQLIYNLLAK